MGDYSCIGPDVICYCVSEISIDDNAVVSQGAHLCAASRDVDAPDFSLIARPISIKAKAWVAADAFVGPGVTIGEGAVLGARGVSFHDLDAWKVYIGNPATELRVRAQTDDG